MDKISITIRNAYNPYDNYYRQEDINPKVYGGNWINNALETTFKNNTIVYKK